MRICMVSSDYLPNPGGIAAHVAGLSQALAALGHDVIVLTVSRHRAKGEDYREGAARVVRVPRLGDRFQRTRAWLLRRALERLHAASPLDIVHFHMYGPDSQAARRFGRAPAVFTNHSSAFVQAVEQGLGPALWGEINHAREFIATSQERADLLLQLGCLPSRAAYIPNAVDAFAFRPDAVSVGRPPFAVHGSRHPDPALSILCPCRLEPVKGVRFLVEAAPCITEGCPDCRLLIAGDGSESATLRTRVAELGLADRVVFLGNVRRADMPGLMASCDVVVLPSLKEATSIAGLEAMACGKPLVGTAVGGIPQIIAEGETGLLVPPADPAALAEAILRLLRDASLRERLGVAARRRVERDFSWPVIGRATIAVYERALAR